MPPSAGITLDPETLTSRAGRRSNATPRSTSGTSRDSEPTVTVVSTDPSGQRMGRCFPARHLRVERPAVALRRSARRDCQLLNRASCSAAPSRRHCAAAAFRVALSTMR